MYLCTQIDPISGIEYTFRRVHELSRKVAQSLATEHGLRKGDVMLMYSPNCVEYVFMMFGAMMVGVTVSFANPTYTQGE